MGKQKETGTLVLRIFFGVAFLVAGLDKVLHLDMAGQMFTGLFGSAGTAMLWLAIAIEVVGGLLLLWGSYVKQVAWVFMPFLLVALVSTWKVGGSDLVSTLREILVMNTAGGNTAVTVTYLAGLLALALLSKEE